MSARLQATPSIWNGRPKAAGPGHFPRSTAPNGSRCRSLAQKYSQVSGPCSTGWKNWLPMTDRFELQRFVDAQSRVYAQVLSELRSGRKRSHWVWFVFPQIEGLGHSTMARRYAIASRDEAMAYLDHPVLG